MQIELPVSAQHPTLVTDLAGGYPSYFIYGPLVFSRRPGNCIQLREHAACCGPGRREESTDPRAWDPPDADTEELVVVSSPFFPHKLANGYSNPQDRW